MIFDKYIVLYTMPQSVNGKTSLVCVQRRNREDEFGLCAEAEPGR